MRRIVLLAAGLSAACSDRTSQGPMDLRLDRPTLTAPIVVASAEDPVGVSANGVVVGRVTLTGADSGFRVFDSTGTLVGPAAVPPLGVWLGGDDGLLYTLVPGALGIASIKPDGSAGPTHNLREAGVLRAIFADSADLTRPTMDGFAVVRVALDGSGERTIFSSDDQRLKDLFGINTGPMGPNAALPSITSSQSTVAIGHGQKYRVFLYDAKGVFKGEIGRDLPKSKLTPRQVETEISQITASQKLDDRYLAILRKQLANTPRPFFTAVQGLRFDRRGLLWIVGYEGDSAFADVFRDTTFVKRFPLSCPGFDGQWDLKGDWLALGCVRADTANGAGEIQLYRIGAR